MVMIMLDATSASTRVGGPATAGIWLEVDGREFPSRGWNDFAVVVLGWWVAAVLRLLDGESTRETVHFMDGPYAVEVTQPFSSRLRFRGLGGASRRDEVVVGEGRAAPFLDSLLSASRTMLDLCRAQGWWSPDAQELKDSSEALEAAVSRLET